MSNPTLFNKALEGYFNIGSATEIDGTTGKTLVPGTAPSAPYAQVTVSTPGTPGAVTADTKLESIDIDLQSANLAIASYDAFLYVFRQPYAGAYATMWKAFPFGGSQGNSRSFVFDTELWRERVQDCYKTLLVPNGASLWAAVSAPASASADGHNTGWAKFNYRQAS